MKFRMDDMTKEATGVAEPQPETAETGLEATITEILDEVIQPENEAPEPAPETELAPEKMPSEELVLSQEDSASPEPEREPEAKEEGELSPDIQRSIDKRIAKVVAKQKTAEERASEAETKAEELSAQLEELKDQPSLREPMESGSNPVSRAKNLDELSKEANRAEQVLDWSDDMLMQLKSDPDQVAGELKKQKVDLRDQYGEEDYTSERMDLFLSQLRRKTDKTLRRSVPERQHYLEAKELSDARAKDLFPWMGDESSQLNQDAEDVINTLPEIKRLPHHKTAAGVFALGLEQLRKIEAEQKGNRKRSAEAPSSQPGAPAAAAAVEPNAQPEKGQKALKSWSESGRPEDFDKFIGTLIE